MRQLRLCSILILFWLIETQYQAVNAAPKLEVVVKDIWNRRLNEYGITLVDWQGYMANPAIQFELTPPADAVFPATATLLADNDRLYFDLAPACLPPTGIIDPCGASTVGANGPTRLV